MNVDTIKNLLYTAEESHLWKVRAILNGGPGSGNFGHAGIPGQRGGSAPGSANTLVEKTKIVMRKKQEVDDAEPYDSNEYQKWVDKSKELDDARKKLARIYSDITNGNLDREYINNLADSGIEGNIKKAIQERYDVLDKYQEISKKLDNGESMEDYKRGSPDYIRVSREISTLKKEYARLEKLIPKTEEKAYDEIIKFKNYGGY